MLAVRDILGLPVVTESGTTLGVVRNVVLDEHSHTVVHYSVGRQFMKPRYVISPKQVKVLTTNSMVVFDSAVMDSVKASRITNTRPNLEAALPRVEE